MDGASGTHDHLGQINGKNVGEEEGNKEEVFLRN
jgi:hypothetical protein